MQKRITYPLLAAALFLVCGFLGGCGEVPVPVENTPGEQKITVTDLSGREVEIAAPAEKIAAIGPGALRLVCYVNGAAKVAGVEELEKNNPTAAPYLLANPSLLALPAIGPGGPDTTPDAEMLVSLGLDVIFTCQLVDQARAEDLQAKTGIPVVVLDYGTLSTFSQEIYDSLALIGQITGEEARAGEVLDFLEECRKDLNARTGDIPENEKPLVYVGGINMKGAHGIESTFGQYPPLAAIMAKNAADETGREGSLSIDPEQLLAWDPEIIFIDAGGLQLVKDDYKKDPAVYRSLSAVKEGEVYSLIPYNWYWTNIDTAIADAYYAGKVLYPERFADIDPVEKADEIYRFLLGKPVYEKMAAEYTGFGRITLE